MGSPCCPLSDLITLQPPVGKSHRELLSRGGDGAVRGRRARPKCWQQIRSQREEWKTVILLVYFYLYFLCMCVCGEISYFFCGHTCPLLLLLSGMAHNECNVRKSFGKRFLLTPPGSLELQFRQALATEGLACELAILLGPQGTKGIRDQDPSS